MANSEELRNRYRRDFTNEPIGRRPEPTPERTATPPKPVADQPGPEPAFTVQPLQQIEEPAPAVSVEHISQKRAKPRRVKRKISRKLKVMVFLVTVIVLAGIGAGIAFLADKPAKQPAVAAVQYFPASIRSQLKTPLFYPENLPTGFVVNNDFKVIQANTLSYTAKAPDGSYFYITLQPAPKDFNFQDFEDKLSGKTNLSTTVGNAAIGMLNSSLVSSIRTTNSGWIIVNTDNLSDLSQMKTLDKAFRSTE